MHMWYNITIMDLTSVKIIKELLSKYKAQPSKRLGQNFLIDKNVLDKIIKTADLKPNDTVLEVGPGIGTLTQELAKSAGKVIAVEKDKKMCEILNSEILNKTLNNSCAKNGTIVPFLAQLNNIEIIHGDILKLNPKRYTLNPNYKVVANIPYYLTSPIIRKFLESDNPPTEIILMVQKEVGQRICAKPPSPPHQSFKKTSGVGARMSLLAVSVQFYAEAKIISYVSKNCFWPSPKVDSAIIKIIPGGLTSRKAGGQTSPDLFFRIVKAGFSQPRKQLGNNLSKVLKIDRKKIDDWLAKNNIKPTQRAETLSIDDWISLSQNF